MFHQESQNEGEATERDYLHMHKIHFEVDQLDPQFPLAAKLIGKGRDLEWVLQGPAAGLAQSWSLRF